MNVLAFSFITGCKKELSVVAEQWAETEIVLTSGKQVQNPYTDIEVNPELASGKLCLAIPGKLYIVYLPEGGNCKLSGLSEQMIFRWFDPAKGKFVSEEKTAAAVQNFDSKLKQPIGLIVSK
jgi:hypothetical protein